ncbi:MAG TPA: Ig-like domain-containing protein, partial [Flavilitoribacter sp.]|nr:Ig-like domain-containing protein [Flavilitoribacter sp.]
MEHVFYAKYFHRIIFFIFLISGSQLCRGEAYYYPVPVEQTVRSFLPPMPPPPLDCNDPLVGKGVVVDKISGSLASLLSNSPDFDNAIDGDLSNYTEIGLTSVTGVGSVSLISVKDLNQDYPAGQRAGFVIEITNSLNGLLGADVLNSLQLRTYLDNELQETAFTGGGAPISLNILSGQGKKRRLDFLTTEPFDEIELVFTGVASSSLLSTFRIYYAYEEIDGCNYNCATALTTAHYPSVTASTDCEVFVPVLGCTDAGFNNFSNTTNSDTTDYASDPFLLLESHYLDLNIGQDIPAGYDVGFAVQQVGLLGILDVNVLGGMVITTYNNGNPTPVETFNANTSLANVAALSSGVNLISFKVSQPFDQVRIRVTSALSILTTYRIYYGFIRPDSDGDGFPDCVDKCAGNDNLDADGDGTPDACDTDCMVDAGLDATACPPDAAFALSPAGAGETWSAAAGNPSSATIDSNGDISGLSAEGTYLFVLSNGACSDTVAVDYLYTQGDLSCNDPMAGPGTVISNNGSCTLCGDPNAGNLLDGDLSNYIQYGNLLSLSLGGGASALVSVQDTNRTFGANTRVGFTVSFPNGLLSVGLLDAFVLRTYNNGVLAETATSGGGLLTADAVAATGQQRIAFVASQDFDEVELVVQGGLVSLDLLTTIRIFYAFTEPENCPSSDNITDITDICGIPLTVSADYCASIAYDHSGFTGVGCVGCVIDSLSNVVDEDLTRPATIDLIAAALGEVSVSVKTTQVIPGGAEAGFAVGIEPSLLAAGLLDDIELTTYLGGSQVENMSGSSPLVTANLLGGGTDVNFISFVTTSGFDEIQITFDAALASSSALGGTIDLFYGFVRYDADADGSPDCMDKCCGSPDYLDMDADGLPDGCDSPLFAADDTGATDEDMPVVIDVIANDDFGQNGPGNAPVQVIINPNNGVASVADGGTPNDPSDDMIQYSPNPDFNGMDTLAYTICDANFSCDTALVVITVNAVDDPVTAVDDPVMTDEDTPVTVTPGANDLFPDGATGMVTVLSGPTHGSIVFDDNGTPNDPTDDTLEYTPDADYHGQDQITYQVCDADGDCDTADIIITVNPVNDAVDAIDDVVATNMDTPVTVTPGANDLVPDGGAGTISVISGPANGTYTLDDNGTPNDPTDDTIEYTPDPGFVGADMITYQICDVDNDCDQAVITFNVFDPNIGCNNPIAGKMAIVDQFSAGLSTLLLGGTDYEAVVDTNLENYVELDISLAAIGSTLVSVKDLDTDYPAGRRVGFVIESVGGLLTADVLQSLRMNTYLDNALQESEDFIGGAASVSLLGGPGGKRRVAFVTDLPFDEVELALSSTVSGLTALRIYYAYQEDPACNSDCTLAVIPNNGFTPAIVGARTGDNGLCVLCFVQDANDLIDNDTLGTPATLNFGVALGGSLSISTTLGSVQPAGTDAGFVIRQDDVLNLLDLSVLGNYRIRTYEGGTLRDDEFLNGSVANVGLLPGNNLLSVSITSTQPFDEIRLTVNRGVNLIEDTEVYYAFIREDADNDGVPDCIDKCPGGDDNILNNRGEPLGCNPVCPDVAGLDVNACPGTDGGSAQLPAAPLGYTWSAVPGNPSVASIDNNGTVTGMSAQGVYYFALDNGVCFDTVAVNFLETQGNISCNDPLAGPDVVINNNGGCELCGAPNAGNITDGDLSNYVQYGNLLALSIGGGSTPLIAVRDTVQEYPAGTRTGFVVSFPSGLLSVSLLDAFSLRTYNNGVLVETATHDGGGLLTADALAASGQQRIAFVSTAPFDEVELVIRSGFVTLDLLTTIRVYYAFTEPESCPSSDNITDITDICGQILTASSGYCGMLGYENTGFTGINCTECRIDSLSNLVDDDFTRPATIELTASAIGEASVSVKTIHTLPAGAEAGYAVSVEASLLTAGVLDDLTLTTYLDGVEQEAYSGSSPLISVALLTDSLGINYISFVTTRDFDEVRLSVDATIASSSVLGGTLRVYYAYVRYDSDGDGTPDCLDKCCSGPDYLDEDGDGNPDACDVPCVTVSAWIYLEGGLIASDGAQNYDTIMRTSLNDLRLLPGQTYEDFFNGPVFSPVGQPFNTAPWHYNGTEGDAFDSGG